jgi:hypothetical protein
VVTTMAMASLAMMGLATSNGSLHSSQYVSCSHSPLVLFMVMFSLEFVGVHACCSPGFRWCLLSCFLGLC